MKKFVGILLSLTLLLIGVSALAEEITLFGNVHFGDDYEEVTAMRKDYPEGQYTYKGVKIDMSSAYDYNNIPVFTLNGITIAGVKNSGVTFAFDKNNKLYQCLYSFGTKPFQSSSSYEKEEADSMYLSTKKLLTEKYGAPHIQYFEDQSAYTLYSFADQLGVPFTTCVEMARSCEVNILQDLYCDKISEWLVLLSNGDSVLIDNFIGFNEPNGFTSKKRSYDVYILYTYIPADVVNQRREENNNWL